MWPGASVDGGATNLGCFDEFVWSPAVCLLLTPRIHLKSGRGQGSTSTAMAVCLGEAQVVHLNLIFSTERGLEAIRLHWTDAWRALKHQNMLANPPRRAEQCGRLEKDL